MVATYNDRKVQMYAFDDNERVYVNGEKISGLSVRKYDSGTVSIQTKKKRGVFSTCLNVMNSLLLYGSLAYTGFHLDDIKHQIFEGKSDGLEQTMQQESPCEYLRENRKGDSVYTCNVREGQTVDEFAERFNEYDMHVMSNRYAPVSKTNVVNAKGVSLKTLTAEQTVYIIANHG